MLFPKAKEYQKLKVEGYNQEEESEIDLYTTDEEDSGMSDSQEQDGEDQHSENSKVKEDFEDDPDGEDKEDQQKECEKNWWDSDSED